MLTFNYFGNLRNEKTLLHKKNLVIFGNCHFQDIQRNIIQYDEIKRNYLPYYISINSYFNMYL